MTIPVAAKLDIWDAINSIYMIFCTALLPLIVIGIALFYSGLTQRRSSLTMLVLPILLSSLVIIDWFIWGYSLCYATSSNRFIGNLNFAVLRNMRDENSLIYSTPRGDILSLNHFLFNGLFKIICVALTFPGCIAERGRILPMLVFLFCWSCIIYNPVTYWFWNKNGWLSVQLNFLPVLDFAGGNCIHIVSGFTTLAYSYILGSRNPKILEDYRNSNTAYMVLGTFLMTIGWCGFIGGCDYKFSTSSVIIYINTIICASVSGIIWTFMDYYYSTIPLDGSIDSDYLAEVNTSSMNSNISIHEEVNMTHQKEPEKRYSKRKMSTISFCSGAMTGLVVITPAGGYIASSTELWKCFVFGTIGAIICNLSTRLKYFFHIDDALDIFAIHGVAGIVGSILTGIFANKLYDSQGGWVKGHWVQIGYQILGSVVTSAYVFILSCVLLYIIDFIPGLYLRIDKNFNQRKRDELKRLKDHQDSSDIENQEHVTAMDPDEPGDWENAELLGSDNYEFNGEYSMDFMEFIKILRPKDYDIDWENTSRNARSFYGGSISSRYQNAGKPYKRE
ncbi:uncharacterized protein PRCAT00001598001 [Priceomyces carsonii]|uniref:uncharacterized protein n=1 Tax=Priceomyces carsonii TaxID=28549 RepID=UPI002ED90571|nr:unnamed protein product [Priceomyces carsonii]